MDLELPVKLPPPCTWAHTTLISGENLEGQAGTGNIGREWWNVWGECKEECEWCSNVTPPHAALLRWSTHLLTAFAWPGPVRLTAKERREQNSKFFKKWRWSYFKLWSQDFNCPCYACGRLECQAELMIFLRNWEDNPTLQTASSASRTWAEVPAERLCWMLTSGCIQPSAAFFSNLKKWRLSPYCDFHSVSSQSFEMVEPVHLDEAEVVCSQSKLQIYAEFLQVPSKQMTEQERPYCYCSWKDVLSL